MNNIFDRLSVTSIIALKKLDNLKRNVVEVGSFLSALESVDTTLSPIIKKYSLKSVINEKKSVNVQKIVLYAFHEAHLSSSEYVEPYHLAISIYHQFDIEKYFTFKHEIKKTLNAENPFQFSDLVQDLTSYKLKDFPNFLGRENELTKLIVELVSGNNKPVLLVGEDGSGKTSLILELSRRIKLGMVPYNLLNMKVLRIKFSALVNLLPVDGNYSPSFMLSKVLTAIVNSERKPNEKVIVFIDDLKMGNNFIFGIEPGSLSNEVFLIGAYEGSTVNGINGEDAIVRFWTLLEMDEFDKDSLKKLVSIAAKKIKKSSSVDFESSALEEIIDRLTDPNMDYILPGNALDIMDKVSIYKKHVKTDYSVQKSLYQDLLKEKSLEESDNLLNTLGDVVTSPTKITLEDVKAYFNLLNGQSIQDTLFNGIDIDSNKLLSLDRELGKYIIGQQEAVSSLSRALRISSLKLDSKNRPIGSFLFLGPTGVGKTETAKSLARLLYGIRGKNKSNPEGYIRIDMAEYTEKHAVSKLFGAPPGYVGYDDGGILANYVREHPSCVVLFDEIDKANPDVLNTLLHIMEEGEIRTNNGETVSFENTIVIMTSNHGTELNGKGLVGFGRSNDGSESTLMLIENLKKYLKPEFINRFDDIIVYNKLSNSDFEKILDTLLIPLRNNLLDRGINLSVSERASKWLVEKGASEEFGARELRRVINKELIDPISQILLKNIERKEIVIDLLKKNNSLSIKSK